ncbi:MAG: hypothetical protein ACT4PZ_13265 [Panacagrimonas sp.]
MIVDPRHASGVASDQAGFLEPPPGGFPVAGSSVRAGQILAYLRPSIPQLERRDLDSELAMAQRDVKLGALQVERFNANEADQFDGQIPLPSIQILGDYRSAKVRETQFQTALSGRAALIAPVDALMWSSRARADLAVDTGETVFELAELHGLVIEVLVTRSLSDPAAINRFQSGRGTAHQTRLVSQTFDPALRTYRLLYTADPSAQLAVGQPVSLSTKTLP